MLTVARARWIGDINADNVSAGFACGLWYVFGGLPIFLSTAAALRLSPTLTSSWLFITCATGALCGLVLSLRYRQPLAITMTIPGWVFLATVGPHYRFEEIVAANLVAGLLILAMGLSGFADRIMRWLPLPIVLGMFAGSILGYFVGVFTQLGVQPWVVGPAVAGFLGARALQRSWLPPIAAGVVLGLASAALAGQVHLQTLRWTPPQVAVVQPVFGVGSLLALSFPLALMTVGIGNVQGLGMLLARGYRPPVNLVTAVVGVASIVNAIFGGHQATVARNGIAILAADDAGPAEKRYVANLVATLFLLLLALNSAVAHSLLDVLPVSLVAALAGLAILNSLLEALRKSITTALPLGSFFALAIAASPLAFFGVGSAFWALVGGLAVSALLERPGLRRSISEEAEQS
jgi:benzoate membrane transport protein